MPAQNLDKQSAHVLKVLNMIPSPIPSNNSHEELMPRDDDAGAEEASTGPNSIRDVRKREWVSILILCFVNLINYMDRFTLAGVLQDVQKNFNIDDSQAGLLQTSFILTYMVFAPLFGYLGDRYSRKFIMAGGVFLWSLTTLLGSFMENFPVFILFRALVGIGEASYSTIAPTIISDLFVKNVRSKMLALFYFAIPVGSGLGYIVGSATAKIMGSWHWALRVTPALGLIAVVLIIFVLNEPQRGASEGSSHLETSSLKEDLKALSTNWSFILSSAGFTCVAFVAGALAWFGPKLISLGITQQPNVHMSEDTLSLIFGIVTIAAGITGLTLGAVLSQRLGKRWPRADPLICSVGLVVSMPLLVGAVYASTENSILCYILLYLGEVALNLNWAIVTDILLYVVLPTRRSTAEGVQLLVSHALGDAGSPYLIGVVSEALKGSSKNTTNSFEDNTRDFQALQYALFITCFVELLGGIFFLLNSFFIVADKKRVEKAIKATSMEPSHIIASETENSSLVS